MASPNTARAVQFNLVSTQAAQGHDQEGARWLEDLARALTSRGRRVDWWMVSSERLDVPASVAGDSGFTARHDPEVDAGDAPAVLEPTVEDTATHSELTEGEPNARGETSGAIAGVVVHRAVEVWQAASTMLQTHLLSELRADGEVVVLAHGWEVAPVLMALDQLLRAEQARPQVLLVCLAPGSLRADEPLPGLDWERLKRACSIIAINPSVRQKLLAERVGSIVIEQGADGARWLSSRSGRPTRTPGKPAEKRSAP